MRRAFALFLAMACALLALGCDEHLIGTNDAELTFRVEPTPASIDTVVADVNARLGAAQMSADVVPRGKAEIALTLDRDSAEAAADLLAWRGGLEVYEVAEGPEAPAQPLEDALAALDRASATAGQKALVLPTDGSHGRVVLAKAPPLVSLVDDVGKVDTVGGKSLVVHLAPDGARKLAEAARAHEGARVAFARSRSVLAVRPLAARAAADDTLTFDFGDDLYAYARAHRTKLLLKSPLLPVLRKVTGADLPTNVPLAVACVVIPMLLSFGWIFFVRRFDRAHPEPMWLVIATFALGGLSVIPAGLAEYGMMRATPYLNPTLMTLGGQVIAFPIALVVFTVVVGLSEEGSKLLGAWALAYQRREFDEPVDGIVYGAISALGFAAVENVKYFTVGRLSAVIIIVRTFMSIPAHMFFGSIWGYAMGRKLVSKQTSVLAFLALAALMHGAFDTFLSIDGMAPLALVLNLALATMFVVLLRKALRHGVVTPAARAAATDRALFQLGSPGGFLGSAIALHVVAAMVFVLGVYMELQHRRVGLGFVCAMSSLLVLLILSAYFLSRTMPLDAAVDDFGITFAGAARAWETILGVERADGALVVRSSEGDVVLGPGSPAVLDELGRAIQVRSLSRAA